MGRHEGSPWRYDRAEVRRVLEVEGLEAAQARWPLSVVRPIARVMGLIPRYRHLGAGDTWKAEWNSLLGTKDDQTLAAELGCSRSTLILQRKKLGIPGISSREQRRDQYTASALALTDEDLSRKTIAEFRGIGIPMPYVVAERKRRKVDVRKGQRPMVWDHSALLRAAVAGMISAHPEATLVEMGKVVGVTREYVRQLLPAIRASIEAATDRDEESAA